jgi:hypothetical protein
MMPIICRSLVLGLLAVAATPHAASAQGPAASRVSVTFGPGIQLTSTTASSTTTFETFSEDGTLTSSYPTGHPATFDGAVTVRLGGALGASVAGSYLHHHGEADVHALVPHPFAFNQPRSVDGTTGVLNQQTALHVDLAYWIQRSPKLDLIISGGPSFFHATQDFVSEISYTQAPPYDTASFAGASVTRDHQSAVGANAALEAGWRLTPHVGVAAITRYSRATAAFTADEVRVTLGGLYLSGALRLLF